MTTVPGPETPFLSAFARSVAVEVVEAPGKLVLRKPLSCTADCVKVPVGVGGRSVVTVTVGIDCGTFVTVTVGVGGR